MKTKLSVGDLVEVKYSGALGRVVEVRKVRRQRVLDVMRLEIIEDDNFQITELVEREVMPAIHENNLMQLPWPEELREAVAVLKVEQLAAHKRKRWVEPPTPSVRVIRIRDLGFDRGRRDWID